jgi:DNA-binding GntR family transcriptional regulator
MNQKSISYQTKEELAYIALRDAIIKCEIPPGEKLVIDRLSEEYGISQIPIRAAIQRLQTEGLVIIHPHSSPVVSPLPPEKIDEVFMLLESLEMSAFRAAAKKVTDQDIIDLEQLIQAMDESLANKMPKDGMMTNIAFHRRIAEISEMDILVDFTDRVLNEWERICHTYFEDVISHRLPQAQEDHRMILEYLRTGEVEKLNQIAISHNRQANLAYQTILQEQSK